MTLVTIDSIVLRDATLVEDSGGWNAPDKRAEKGFTYDSLVDREPLEVSIEAYADDQQLRRLRALRDRTEPLPVTVGAISIPAAKLNSLSVEDDGQYSSHNNVSITVQEVREAEIETAEISIDTEAGAMGSAAAEQEASQAYPETSDGGEVEDNTGGVVGKLSGIRQSLSGVL